jgi:hypothetical protein
MGIVDNIIKERDELLSKGLPAVQNSFNGVDKEKIRLILTSIDRCTNDMLEAVFALLDTRASLFPKAAKTGFLFRDGATVAHVGSHVGILQRGRSSKLDREGRDYWLKPLWEIGAIEKVYFDSVTNTIMEGHPKAKSPNSAYRLSHDFIEILEADIDSWPILMEDWIDEDVMRERLSLQAEQALKTKTLVDSDHSNLIKASDEIYAKRFLDGYQTIYIDDGDGDRITEEQRSLLATAGLSLQLHDAMPDVLLWNPKLNSLWVIEAVTSDGEVDLHKKRSLEDFAKKFNKSSIGFTTTYQTWKKTAERQSQLKNLAGGTYLWVQEDPSRTFFIEQ